VGLDKKTSYIIEGLVATLAAAAVLILFWVTNSMLPNTGSVEIANEKTLVDYVIAGGFFVLLLGIVGGYSFGEAKFSLKSPQPSEKINCQYCGLQNMSDAMFCQKCGKKIQNLTNEMKEH